jgi:hypothetical protein
MNKSRFGVTALLVAGSAMAENVEGVSEMICAAGQAQICFETGECFAATPWELDVPDFVIIDTKKKRISTTEASGLKRSTEFSKVERGDGKIMLQGIENGRAFSFTIHEVTGRMTAAISRDGLTVSVFGACTDNRS